MDTLRASIYALLLLLAVGFAGGVLHCSASSAADDDNDRVCVRTKGETIAAAAGQRPPCRKWSTKGAQRAALAARLAETAEHQARVDNAQRQRLARLLAACPTPATFTACRERFEVREDLTELSGCERVAGRAARCEPRALCKWVEYPALQGYARCEAVGG